ncbi:MAG: EF-hand domain-containing protein [Blastomonas sp.]
MSRILLGGLAAIAMLIAGYAYIRAWQEPDPLAALPPPPALAEEEGLPETDPGDMMGPAPPEATELTREQRRFARYDRNSDRLITRTEMMASRSDAFRKLDKDGNNLLTFEEWAVATSNRFAGADANGDGRLTPPEFATTRPERRPASRCRC